MLGFNTKPRRETTPVPQSSAPDTRPLYQLCSRYAALNAERDKEAAEYQAEQAKLRDKYAPSMQAKEQEYIALKEEITTHCITHRAEEFGDSKSLTVAGVAMQFRAGTPSVQIIDIETTNWKTVLQLAQKHAPDCVVNKPELNKTKLKSLGAQLLKKLGLHVVAEESFSISIKK
jgi:phage host-nuclease inhibitor protein Gam